MIQQKGTPKHFNSNDEVIMFVDSVDVKKMMQIGGGFDYPTITSFYNEDPNRRHKGMMSLWGQQTNVNYQESNIVQDLYMKGSVLEVNGWDGGYTYDLPIYDYKGCYVTRDTSNQNYAGIEGNKFKLVLNKPYTAGDTLSADKEFGQTVQVSYDDPVVAVAEGYEHTVTLVTNSKSAFYDTKYLVKGVQYEKVSHYIGGERGTKFSNLSLPDSVGTMRCEFRIGAFSGVEAYMTGKADATSFRGGDAKSNQYLDMLAREFGADNKYAVLAPLKRGADGTSTPDFKNMKLGATLQFLTMRELEKLTHNRLMWGEAGTVQGENGAVKLNEGLWRQLRRGKVDTYARPGGITRAHLVEMANYIFKVNPTLKTELRRIVFKCGKFAYQNVLEIIKDEVKNQIDRISPLLGSDPLIKNVITGDLMNLGIKPVRFTNVYCADMGWITVEEDESLNFGDSDRLSSRGIHPGGLAHSAYSIVCWNADDQMYSNNKELPKGAKRMEGNSNELDNINLIKPQGEMLYFGSTNGRYNTNSARDIASGGAIKQIGQEFWCFQICDVHLLDPSTVVMLELDPKARKGFN